MSFRKPKLIVADIDGTIVDDVDRLMSKRTVETFERLHKDGCILGIASGRPLSMNTDKVKNVWNISVDFDFIIGLNGGELLDNHTGKVHSDSMMPKDIVKEVLGFMEPFKDDVAVYVYDGDAMKVTRSDDIIEASALRNSVKIEIVTLDEIAAHAQTKLMFRAEPDIILKARDYAATYQGDHFVSFLTQPTMLEFQLPGIDKGKTLVKYCELNHIPIEDTWAFGDTTNDNGLLKEAGLGVCMTNGTDDTKACADVISEYDNNEDGFARFIEKYYFMEE